MYQAKNVITQIASVPKKPTPNALQVNRDQRGRPVLSGSGVLLDCEMLQMILIGYRESLHTPERGEV